MDSLVKLKEIDFQVSGRLGKALADIESWRREQASFIVQRGLLFSEPKFRNIAKELKHWNETDIFSHFPNLELSAEWLLLYLTVYLTEKKEEKQLQKLQDDYTKFGDNLTNVLEDVSDTNTSDILIKLLSPNNNIQDAVEAVFASTKSSVAVIPNMMI